MQSLELKIPPPVVAALTGCAMWVVSRYVPPLAVLADAAPAVRVGAALVLAVTGGCFDLAGVVAFWRARTTVNPLRPEKTAAIVTSGIYRITRNPMYVGMACMLLAWAVYLSCAWALAGPLAFVLYITRFQIKPEERVLAARFGSGFADYKASVRRWL